MFESDAAWETALDSLDADIESLAAFAGKLTDAVTIGAYLDASTEVGRKVERLYCYASQRHDEDTRDDKAQSMYARIGSKYVKMAAALSFAQPEILSLPEETLTAIVNDPAVADYKFNLEDLLRGKPHTLTQGRGKLLASFGEVMSAPSEIYHNLEDADLLFDAVKDGSGETVEVTGSNFVPLEMSTDRTLRENAFHSYYKSYREHINTFAASYAGAIKAATAERRPQLPRPPARWPWRGRMCPPRSTTTSSPRSASIFPPCTAMSACAKRCWALTRCTSMRLRSAGRRSEKILQLRDRTRDGPEGRCALGRGLPGNRPQGLCRALD